MKYIASRSVVDVIGTIWMPSTTAAMRYELSRSDVDNARGEDGKLTRESVELWLGAHAGDFSSIADFSASLEDGAETVDISWADADSEVTFSDCMFGDEF